jgi:CBS domain-containing protein
MAMVSRADTLRWTMGGWDAGKSLGEQLADQEPLVGYDDDLVGSLADRMAAADIGRVPILRRADGKVIGLVARRDLLRVRASVVRQERERAVLLRFGTAE